MLMNSVILFEIMKKLSNSAKAVQIYRKLMLEENNTGPRFQHGRNDKHGGTSVMRAYWPTHFSWIEHAKSFPNCMYADIEHVKDQRFPNRDHFDNLTFASHAYNVLKELCANAGAPEKVRDLIIKVCRAHNLDSQQLDAMISKGPEQLDDILAYMVEQSANASGAPLYAQQNAPGVITEEIAFEALPVAFARGDALVSFGADVSILHEIRCIADALACPAVDSDFKNKQLRALRSVGAVLQFTHHASRELLGRVLDA